MTKDYIHFLIPLFISLSEALFSKNCFDLIQLVDFKLCEMPRNSSTVCDRQRDFQSIVSSQSPFEAHQLEFARASRAFELILLFLRALYAECELNKSASPVMGPASSRDAAANRRIVNWCGGSVLCRLGASASLSFSVAGFKEATEGETGRPILHYFLSDFLFTEFFFHSCLCVSVCVCVCVCVRLFGCGVAEGETTAAQLVWGSTPRRVQCAPPSSSDTLTGPAQLVIGRSLSSTGQSLRALRPRHKSTGGGSGPVRRRRHPRGPPRQQVVVVTVDRCYVVPVLPLAMPTRYGLFVVFSRFFRCAMLSFVVSDGRLSCDRVAGLAAVELLATAD